MEFFRVYGRVIGLLRAERGLAIMLALANVAVAALQFYEPVLFGKVVDLLANAQGQVDRGPVERRADLLVLWAAVGIGGIVANIVVSLQADRMAHRRRLGAMANFFEHVLVLPFSFHNAQHSGRLIKVMLTGVDHLFGIWLSFFRENLATFVALFIMLPLSLFMNWRLGLLLIVLILFFAVANIWVVGKHRPPAAAGRGPAQRARRPRRRRAGQHPSDPELRAAGRRDRRDAPHHAARPWRRSIRC